MSRIKLLALGVFSVVFASAAQAALLSFETLTEESEKNLNSAVSNGGNFSSSQNFNLHSSAVFPAFSPSGFYGAVSKDVESPIAISSAVAFDFNGFWLTDLPVNAPSLVATSGFDRVNSLKSAGTKTIIEEFEAYVEVNFVEINRNESFGDQYFTVNDVNFSKRRSNVPDPSSFFLLGIGILALAVARRNSAV